ncbi:hypothetical protein SAMN04489735_104525 [Aneurinibacillus thermoaerophilus]|uniref:Uncharacterized protein n=1 Tax=Aneurinibacillus thermoaerophilus TaxID=143495 RepID=A0A1G8ELI8_ANETH|nr:hypothetical protein [Aneurinibacillus thermoaerophilus]SDH70579.1 hypothetical protein SAMN04489735_104525 [Aneurinibacillus thermoaerophilus]
MSIEFKEIANILDAETATVELADVNQKDRLLLIKNGVLYEAELPKYGELTAAIHNNRLDKFKVEVSVTIPGKRTK